MRTSMRGDTQQGVLVDLTYEVANKLLYWGGEVRRSQISKFMWPGRGEYAKKAQAAIRLMTTPALNQLASEGVCSPGRTARVSYAPTGSGRVTFWNFTGRQACTLTRKQIAAEKVELRKK